MDTRRTIALTAFLAGGLLLAACGDDDATTSGSASSAEEDHGDDGHDAEETPAADGARELAVVANDTAFAPQAITRAAGEAHALAHPRRTTLHDSTIDERTTHVDAD